MLVTGETAKVGHGRVLEAKVGHGRCTRPIVYVRVCALSGLCVYDIYRGADRGGAFIVVRTFMTTSCMILLYYT